MTSFADIRYDAARPGADILQLVTYLLQSNRGVFIGEAHDQHLARDFLLAHMRELKQAGVDTIYFEANDRLVSATRTHGVECLMAKDLDKMRQTNPDVVAHIEEIRSSGAETFRALTKQGMGLQTRTYMQQLIDTARAEDVDVIGHDTVGNSYPALSMRGVLEHIDQRDINSAHLITRTAPTSPASKFLILGGADHSRRPAIYVLPDQDEIALEKGLPERLNIPSLDFTSTNHLAAHRSLQTYRDAIDTALATKPYALTTITDGSADYAVIHRPGASLLGEDARQLPGAYTVPFTMFDEPDCKYQVTDDAVILPPMQVDSLIRRIKTARGR